MHQRSCHLHSIRMEMKVKAINHWKWIETTHTRINLNRHCLSDSLNITKYCTHGSAFGRFCSLSCNEGKTWHPIQFGAYHFCTRATHSCVTENDIVTVGDHNYASCIDSIDVKIQKTTIFQFSNDLKFTHALTTAVVEFYLWYFPSVKLRPWR